MDREPKISELEKLINHFRNTGRESELFEALAKHNIAGPKQIEAIDEETNEIHPEAVAIEKIAESEGLITKTSKAMRAIRQNFKEKWYLRYGIYYVLIFCALFAVLNAPLFISQFSFKPKVSQNKVITVQELKTIPMESTAPLSPGEVIPEGNQLSIPKLSIKAPIIFVPTTDEKTVQANLPNGVVHYAGTAKPGEVGNSFLTGHSSNYWWMKGSYNYVFVHLNKLAVGDQAVIYSGGKKLVYQVTSTKVVAPSDTSVLAQTDTPTLTLMTCTPPGTNWKRLIVSLDQIAPKYQKPVMVSKTVTVPNEELPGDSNTVGAFFLRVKTFFTNIF